MFTLTVTGGRKTFTMAFKHQINAEIFRYSIAPEYSAKPDFELKYSGEELSAEKHRQEKIVKEAQRLQKQAVERTSNNYKNPNYNPCEICGGKHENYHCCDRCNHDNHRCHFCGDYLGHSEVSACYILDGLGD
jgi:hypothetical protein